VFTADQIKNILEKAFPQAQVAVTDLTGTQDHYQVRIVTEAFKGKNLMSRHREVYKAIGNPVGGEIHALSLQTLTPEEV